MPTIYEIKRATATNSPYFFERKTLKFFNQTMKGFKVKKSPTGRTFIYAPFSDGERVMGCTFREFTGDDLVTPEMPLPRTVSEVLEYIENH